MRGSLKFRRTTIILMGLLAFLAGLGIAKFAVGLPAFWIWIAALAALVSFKQKGPLFVISLLLFACCLGWWRGSVMARQLRAYQSLYEQKVIIQGRALSDGEYTDHTQIGFDLGKLKAIKPTSQPDCRRAW